MANITAAMVKELREMTGAGMMDCKKALTEADGDIKKAVELVRERGLAIAAKRSDRTTSNGCVLAKYENGFAAMIALKCETDFVANGADFIQLTQDILDADLYFIERIGLKDHLSPTRSNGLLAMVKRIKAYALAFSLK